MFYVTETTLVVSTSVVCHVINLLVHWEKPELLSGLQTQLSTTFEIKG
jgi:hypothetical protein